MARIRRCFLGIATVLSVGLVAAATASAHAFFVEEKEVTAAETIGLISESSVVESSILGVKGMIECTSDAGYGKLEEKGKFKGEIKLENCTVNEITAKGTENVLTACTVSEPAELSVKGELVNGASGGVEDELKAEKAEEVLVEDKIEGAACALKGTYKLKGTQICQLSESELASPEHELLCADVGDKLKLGAEPARSYILGTAYTTSSKLWYSH